MSNKPVSNLSSLLSDSAINLDAAPSTWQDAITQAGALLEHEGAIDPDYTAAMIQSVVDNGPVSYTHLTLPTTPYV